MPAATRPSLTPRKTPRQARATVTVDAIFEATIQLLIRSGTESLTTTRVAERAGVSVGTMYQYFPNKQALIYALNGRYLDALAKRIEACCIEHEGETANTMLTALIDTYWQAKTERSDVTRALYRSVADLDNSALLDTFAARVDQATTSMFASACDADFEDLASVNLTLITVIFGTVRNAFERRLNTHDAALLRDQLLMMCTAYLETLRNRKTMSEARIWAVRCHFDADNCRLFVTFCPASLAPHRPSPY